MIWTRTCRLSRLVRLVLIAGVIPAPFLLPLEEVSYASTVTYTLSVDANAGSWQLFGEASLGDNAGLATIGVTLQDIDTPVDLQLPMSWIAPNFSIQGFIDFRSNANPISGSQNLGGSGVVYGFGQTAGTLGPPADTFIQQNYDARLLIAQGTFDALGPRPSFSNADATVWDSSSGISFHSPGVFTDVIPEPVSAILALLALGTGVLSRRQWMAR